MSRKRQNNGSFDEENVGLESRTDKREETKQKIGKGGLVNRGNEETHRN